MSANPLLGPVIALVAWTLVMFVWMAVARSRAFKALGRDFEIRRGFRGGELDSLVEPRFQWPAHNYVHLHEQPTIFYAICFALILLGGGGVWINLVLAWGYVAIRIVHSIFQATVNIVQVRAVLFLLATFCLIGLTVHAAARFLHAT
jgi:hypothetical protein